MATRLIGNCEGLADLVVGAALPSSAIDAKYVRVARGHKVYHATIPSNASILEDLNAPEWKTPSFLQKTFTIPITRKRQKKPQEAHYVFPYCLLIFGPASTSLRERLIVINWWLNLSKKEKQERREKIKHWFSAPNVSADLSNQHDESKPKAVGIFDNEELREGRAQETRSQQILQKRQRTSRHDPPTTNAQLRDSIVREQEAQAQRYVANTIHRSRITEEHKAGIDACYEPFLITSSTAYTPTKRGRPDNTTRSEPKMQFFGRNREAMASLFDPLARALKDNEVSIESLTGGMIVDLLQGKTDSTFHFQNDAQNWPGPRWLKERRKKGKSIVPLPDIFELGANNMNGTPQTRTTGQQDSQVSPSPVIHSAACLDFM